MRFFRRLSFRQTPKVRLAGEQILTVSISLLVLAALWLVVVLTSLLLTTLILSKKPNNSEQKCLSQLGSGFSQVPSSD
jgi:hypothetical protein